MSGTTTSDKTCAYICDKASHSLHYLCTPNGVYDSWRKNRIAQVIKSCSKLTTLGFSGIHMVRKYHLRSILVGELCGQLKKIICKDVSDFFLRGVINKVKPNCVKRQNHIEMYLTSELLPTYLLLPGGVRAKTAMPFGRNCNMIHICMRAPHVNIPPLASWPEFRQAVLKGEKSSVNERLFDKF